MFNFFFPHPYANMKAVYKEPIWPTTGKFIYSCPCFSMKFHDCGEIWRKSRSKNNSEQCTSVEDLVKTDQQLTIEAAICNWKYWSCPVLSTLIHGKNPQNASCHCFGTGGIVSSPARPTHILCLPQFFLQANQPHLELFLLSLRCSSFEISYLTNLYFSENKLKFIGYEKNYLFVIIISRRKKQRSPLKVM